MAGKPESISNETLVDTIVDKIYYKIENREDLDWESFWEECWKDIVDEARYYGLLVANTKTPEFPTKVLDLENHIEEIKKLLVQALEQRTGETPKPK